MGKKKYEPSETMSAYGLCMYSPFHNLICMFFFGNGKYFFLAQSNRVSIFLFSMQAVIGNWQHTYITTKEKKMRARKIRKWKNYTKRKNFL